MRGVSYPAASSIAGQMMLCRRRMSFAIMCSEVGQKVAVTSLPSPYSCAVR